MTVLVIGKDCGERAGIKQTIQAALPMSLRVLDAGEPSEALALLEGVTIDCVVATPEAAAGGWREFVESWVAENPALRELLFIVVPPSSGALSALDNLH